MVKNNQRKGQTFSTDIIVVIVIILFGALFLVMNKINTIENVDNINTINEKATENSKVIFEKLKNDEILDSENKVDVDHLLQLSGDELKDELGIDGDFAIVFEKNGNLVKIDPINDVNCIGSESIIVNGQACKN